MRFEPAASEHPETGEIHHIGAPARRSGGRRLWIVVAAAAAVLLVGAGAGAVAFMSRDSAADTGTGTDPEGIGNADPAGASGLLEAGASGSASAPASAAASASGKPGATTKAAGGAANAPGAPPITPAAGKRWTVGFSEEFNGTALDKSKLTPCFDWNSGDCTSTFNGGREHYQPSQVQVSGGTAKLIAAPLSPAYKSSACQGGSCTYKAGLVSTARPNSGTNKYLYSFTYGYVESRLKFPGTQGFFTAFWMLPADPSYNYRSELDILEVMGNDPASMFMTYHWGERQHEYHVNDGKKSNGKCPAKDYSKDYVRLAVDWEPDHISWYIDGVECARFSDASAIENGPMQLLLHMMVDNEWQRSWNVGLTDPTLTRQLEVDYIRVYQQTAA
ncbi:glycoside hydrolase family 16 protein [Dactylosporangium sp. CS-033363]|uniref:glycoside hydrolase family 16 protein n=1 Tax=Dactylosporangium sp. CS-033363 TaxID=3239935 RepID=UPI003D925440